MKPVQHYLQHIPMMIERQGVLKAYSGRSMERTIGRYKKLIKSKVNVGANAGNVMERFAMYGYVNSLNLDIRKTLNLLEPKKYSANTYVPLDANDKSAPQLWSPMSQSLASPILSFLSLPHFKKALEKYIRGVYTFATIPSSFKYTVPTLAGRVWYSHIYNSEYYKEHIKEERRGNHYYMFEASYIE